MNIIDKFFQWIDGFFRQPSDERESVSRQSKPAPPVVFSRISLTEKPPKNDVVENGVIYCVSSNNKLKWTLLRCPCGCQNVITLSLQGIHRPHWKLNKSDSGLPTLHPSVWRDVGCLSHFWVKDGRIYWCGDTGKHPSLRH